MRCTDDVTILAASLHLYHTLACSTTSTGNVTWRTVHSQFSGKLFHQQGKCNHECFCAEWPRPPWPLAYITPAMTWTQCVHGCLCIHAHARVPCKLCGSGMVSSSNAHALGEVVGSLHCDISPAILIVYRLPIHYLNLVQQAYKCF